MTDLILHHYSMSPFAEKARAMLAYKKLPWKSVKIPFVMPKPDLMPLTGGYRKTPVLQIGADVYCDTLLIGKVLERLHPVPSLYPAGTVGTADIVAWWADHTLFNAATAAVFSETADSLPAEFFADRAAFSGQPMDPTRIKAAKPMLQDAVKVPLAWIENALSNGRDWVLGDQLSVADLACYHCVWFIAGRGGAPHLLEGFPLVRAWHDRIVGFGKGLRTEMDSKEALAVAKAATPLAVHRGGSINGIQPGANVRVRADDSGKDPVTGELLLVTSDEIVIRRTDDLVGEIHQHFPRAGFLVSPAK